MRLGLPAGRGGDLAELPLLEPERRSGLILQWRRYPFPIAWDAQFGAAQAADLHLEIGFGDGRYTLSSARRQPMAAFVGMEISSASLLRAYRRIAAAGPSNVRLLKVGARFGLRHLFGPATLGSITVNFPDPWPKHRHAKHRLLKRSFFELAAARLVRGGRIKLATDHGDYLDFAKREAEASGLYQVEQAPVPEEVERTKYALKWRSQGRRLYYQVFTCQGGPAVPSIPILERDVPMPHALLSGTLPERPEFGKQVVSYADGHVVVHELSRVVASDKGERERWLLRATVQEPDLRQQVLVSVTNRGHAELIVQIEPFGDPVLTSTTRGAVHAVAEWLLAQETVSSVTRRAY